MWIKKVICTLNLWKLITQWIRWNYAKYNEIGGQMGGLSGLTVDRWWGDGVLGLLQICSNRKGTWFTKMHDEVRRHYQWMLKCEEYFLNKIILIAHEFNYVMQWKRLTRLSICKRMSTFPLTFWLAREHNTQPGWHKKPFRIVSVSDEHYDQDLRLEVLQFGKVVVIS